MENLKEQPKYMERVNRLKEKVFETYPEIDLEDARFACGLEIGKFQYGFYRL